MATYNNSQNRKYYFISYGKIRTGKGDNVEEFTGIDGVLKDIVLSKVKVKGEERTFTEFQFEDAGEKFSISCELYGGQSNAILRRLANVKDFSSKILIEVWATDKDGKSYTNLSVIQNGERVEWVGLPDLEQFRLPTGEVIKSTKKREEFIDNLILEIRTKLNPGTARQDAPVSPEPIEDGPEGTYFSGEADYQPNIG